MLNDPRHNETQRLLHTLAQVQPPAAMNDRLVRSLRQAQAKGSARAGLSLRYIPVAVALVVLAILGGYHFKREFGHPKLRRASESIASVE